MYPKNPLVAETRVLIGEKQCSQPYSASLLNISGMSFVALSAQAITALSLGAAEGGFAHNTGEGGVSAGGADLISQIGTGYFGCRTPAGDFDPARFADQAAEPAIKAIEIKLSRGAKPGLGGIQFAGKPPRISRSPTESLGRQTGRLQAMHRATLGILSGRPGHERHRPSLTSSPSTGQREAPERHRPNFPIRWAYQCARASVLCTTLLSIAGTEPTSG